jgi:hypothetical protein
MSLIFNDSNFIQNVQEEGKIKQYIFYYEPIIQKIKIENAVKIVVHCWGGGGGGGGSRIQGTDIVSGSGGGGAFTILDFPFYPFKEYFDIEVQVGKGGEGGYSQAENGGDTIVRIKDRNGRIQKEFVSYGGEGGKGNSTQFVKGGDGGMNLKNGVIFSEASGTSGSSGTSGPSGAPYYKTISSLMGANYVSDSILTFPKGGKEEQPYGDHCQMSYLSVSGSGGGANFGATGFSNHGGSFILQQGGLGAETKRAGGGGSTYYGRGGDGGILYEGTGATSLFLGKNGEINSGAGGGGSISKYNLDQVSALAKGGNGANGLAIIEVYY